MRLHPGRRICPEQIGQLFGEAYYKAATPENAKSGFEASGIVPFNGNIIPEDVCIPQAAEDSLSVSIEEAASEMAVPEASTSEAGSFVIMDTSISNATFSDIMAIPELKIPKKKRSGERSEILTSSPYKKCLQAAQDRQNSKGKRKAAKPLKKLKKGPVARKRNVFSEQDTECFVCGQWWHDAKPGENWIRCIKCNTWVHENCAWTSTSGQVCDLC